MATSERMGSRISMVSGTVQLFRFSAHSCVVSSVQSAMAGQCTQCTVQQECSQISVHSVQSAFRFVCFTVSRRVLTALCVVWARTISPWLTVTRPLHLQSTQALDILGFWEGVKC